MIVQIYEIQTPQEVEKCIESGVDHIGSVLSSKEAWRQPQLKEAFQVSKEAGVKNSLIPLFQEEEALHRALDYYVPDFLHFCDSLSDHHGNQRDLESMIDLQKHLKQEFPEIGMMRTIPIPLKDEGSKDFPFLENAQAFESISDVFLIDTWVQNEPINGFVGITGRTPDWNMARELVLQTDVPVILAGGLSPDNVYEALLKVLPAGADSCTQTNMTDESGNAVRFKKDFEKVKKFVSEVRRAEEAIHEKAEELSLKLDELREALKDREAALPAHSVRPHQIMIIEELEEEIALKEKELKRLRYGVVGYP
jgi:phosphoribosylanthranilate isomerase